MSDRDQEHSEILEVPLVDAKRLGDSVIWRYMDFYRFQELLDTNRLFFPTKSRYGDLLEGSFGDDHVPVQVAAAQSVAALPDGMGPPINDEDDGLVWHRMKVQHPNTQAMNLVRRAHETVGISCWTCREHEMVPLWSLYTKPESGVAIRSRLSAFRSAVSEAHALAIHVGHVRYVVRRPEGLTGSPFKSLLYKSRWWEHEKEIRFMMPYESDKPNPAGCCVPVDVGALIDGIVISPIAGYGFADTVQRSMEKAGLSPKLVEKSAITGTVSRL